jgi:hypothetical protein
MLLGLPPDHQRRFYALAQERYREFMSRGETSPIALIKPLDEALAGHPVVAKVETAQ